MMASSFFIDFIPYFLMLLLRITDHATAYNRQQAY